MDIQEDQPSTPVESPMQDQTEHSTNKNVTQDMNISDDVKHQTSEPEKVEKVVQEKLVYYCSSFDLNVNEWFTEYENTIIFKKRMKQKLGQNWVKYFYQAMEVTHAIDFENEGCNDSEDLSSEDTEDIASNHCLNIAIEYYLIVAKAKEKDDSFETFHEGMKEYFCNKGYKIIDDSLFKSLVHTFHIVAETEEVNISNKRKTDEIFNKEYRKSGKKRDMKNKEKEEVHEEDKQRDPKRNHLISDSIGRGKLKNMIPGFSLIKSRIITPLLIASEKVVEYMIPDTKDPQNKPETQTRTITEKVADAEEDENVVVQKMDKLSLEDERKQRKRTMKLLRKSNQNINISKNLIQKASDCVDFISERTQVESKVTSNFVTNMVELSESAVKRISASVKGQEESNEQVNMRFIKPSKKFYNLLMSVWVKMDYTTIFSLTEENFVENVKQALIKDNLEWSDDYLKPTKAFFAIAKEEFINLYRIQKDDALELEEEPRDFVFSMSRFFTTIKSGLLEMWNSEIVDKSFKFNFASSSKAESGKDEEVKDEQAE